MHSNDFVNDLEVNITQFEEELQSQQIAPPQALNGAYVM